MTVERSHLEVVGESSRRPRSGRTRGALVAAAKEVFREASFHDAKVADVARRAQVAHGSFYTHFASKEDIFMAVLEEVTSEGFISTSSRRELGRTATPASQIEAANRQYFSFFRDNARIMASMETLAASSEAVEDHRQRAVMAYTYRTAASIRAWQSDGGVRPAAVPEDLAYCLGAMVERLAHMLYVLKVTSPDEEACLRALTGIWLSSLGLAGAEGIADGPPVGPGNPATRITTDGQGNPA